MRNTIEMFRWFFSEEHVVAGLTKLELTMIIMHIAVMIIIVILVDRRKE